MDAFKAVTFGIKAGVDLVLTNSNAPGSLDGIAFQITGDTVNNEHPRSAIRSINSNVLRIVNEEKADDKKNDVMVAETKKSISEFKDGKLKIQVEKNGPWITPNLSVTQVSAIERVSGPAIEARLELNKLLINSPNLESAAVRLKGHAQDKELLFTELTAHQGKTGVYLTHKMKDSTKGTTVLAYLGNPPPRPAVLAAGLPIQPLPPQLVNLVPLNPLNPAPLVAANPGQPNPAPLVAANPVQLNPAPLAAANPVQLNPAPLAAANPGAPLVVPPNANFLVQQSPGQQFPPPVQ